MKNKGLIKLFVIAFTLISIYQLSFTFVANGIEDDAQAYVQEKISSDTQGYVQKRHALEDRYLDSISGEQVYNLGIASFTYDEVKNRELNKGLDLKGGINVILQISVQDILKGLSNNTKDPLFNRAIAQANKDSKDSDDTYLNLFFNAFETIDAEAKLASPNIFANKNLSDDINIRMSNEEVKSVIKRKIDESIVSAFEVLRKRIDKFGVVQPNIQRLGDSGRILIELPGAKDVRRVQNLLQSTAQLEFWYTFPNTEVMSYMTQVNQKLKEIVDVSSEKTTASEQKQESEIDSLLSDAGTTETNAIKQPLFDLVQSQTYQGSPEIALFAVKDTAKVNEYLKLPQIRNMRPANLQNAKFLWGKKAKNSELISLYAIRYNKTGKAPLSGSVIDDARQSYEMSNQPSISMQMNSKGARIWEEITGYAYQNKVNIAIVLDDIVYSAPGVTSGAIAGGSSVITGDFTINEATDLANVLRAGKLPASADIIQSEIVGPSLGHEAIESGISSFVIAMIIILVWMILYYGVAGMFANIALVLNILLIFGVLAGNGAVLTLPGIAGIVLTIGMSVDANVIIFERAKEELKVGKSFTKSIVDGFRNALSSILDANVTTGLTAIVLLIFGSGPIKGFATTLIIGIFTSLITAILVTRLFIDGYTIKGNRNMTFSTNATKNLFSNIGFKIIEKRKMFYIISSVLIIISLVSLFTKGINQGVDFLGGRSYQVRFEESVNPSEISGQLVDAIGQSEVKTFGADNQVKITTKYKIDEEGAQIDEEILDKLYTSLQKFLPNGFTKDQFVQGGDDDHQIGVMSSVKIGPTIADDIKIGSIWAVLGSLTIVFLYILLRFRKLGFSVGAVVAVFHDVVLVLGLFSLLYDLVPFNMEINQAFIAAILTVIGYSLNDTVIIFDRIREYGVDNYNIGTLNSALNSTLSRTLNTSFTTLIVLVTIFILGGESLRGFIFAMIVGVIVGTYSSLAIASPIVYDVVNRIVNKKK